MILLAIIIVPFAGGLIAWATLPLGRTISRWICIIALVFELVCILYVWSVSRDPALLVPGHWLAELKLPWIPQIGASWHFALDGISLLLVGLTAFLGILAVVASWNTIQEKSGFFHFNLMWTISAVIGVFMAVDLFVFYVFWELMLVPIYFIIALWGHEQRGPAASKFFIFTQISGLFMLLSILGLYFIHGSATGSYTFDYSALLNTILTKRAAAWLMAGFFFAFAVKLGIVPFHGWLPDAYVQAPAAGSLLLAGTMAKTGAYGLIRFVVPLFSSAAFSFSTAGMVLGVVTILYGAALAWVQPDLKRLIAYSSISHMGFVMLGIFVWGSLSLQGVIIQMISHGIGVAALFMIAGSLFERTHSRQLDRFGGLWGSAPRMGGATMVFALAAMGLPGLGNFVGEFLILLNASRISIPITAVAMAGGVLSVIYALWLVQRVFQGPALTERCSDFSDRELAALSSTIVLIVAIGIFPQLLLDTSAPAVRSLMHLTAHGGSPRPAGGPVP